MSLPVKSLYVINMAYWLKERVFITIHFVKAIFNLAYLFVQRSKLEVLKYWSYTNILIQLRDNVILCS